MKIRIGFAPGQIPIGPAGQPLLRDLVEMADDVGFDSIWLSDRIIGDRFPLEPIVAMSLVAGYSDSLKFGTSVLALPMRNPVLLAKELATLDYLSNGRLLPAIGIGQEDPADYEASGITKDGRGRRSDESIEIIRRLWAEDTVTHEGAFYSFRDVSILPKPIQKPGPPIWIGGRSKAAQRRTGRVGDGWLVSQATPEEIERGIKVIFETASEHDRVVDEDHIGSMLGFCIAPTTEKASTVASPYLIRQRPEVSMNDYCGLGTPQHVADMITKYSNAGATKFVVRPMCPSNLAFEQLQLFGREVLPLFHD
ncbi:LLM class flavin-dependent oxidoreductase [SAR202 cluster bacterium AD-804-J14_MRT_500m]|nr:LLM class flavin-dependent oxidoreductase [SAR202 cluster bacterium AD-804-J14_MRT_500m]